MAENAHSVEGPSEPDLPTHFFCPAAEWDVHSAMCPDSIARRPAPSTSPDKNKEI